MQIKYSPDVDILVIKLNNKPIYESEHWAEQGIVVDYDENNEIVALEIFDWSKRKEIDLPFIGKLLPTAKL
jgi:uncharacterized protein YuzE